MSELSVKVDNPRGKWLVRKMPDDPYSRYTGEAWWTYPPGEDSPDETWRSWHSALNWATSHVLREAS